MCCLEKYEHSAEADGDKRVTVVLLRTLGCWNVMTGHWESSVACVMLL